MDIYTQYYLKYKENIKGSVEAMDNVLNRLVNTETYQDPNEPYRFSAFSKEELIAALVTASDVVAEHRIFYRNELKRQEDILKEAKRYSEEDNNNPYYEQQ